MCYLCTAVNETQSAHITQGGWSTTTYQAIGSSGNSNIDNMIIGSQTGNTGQAATIRYTFTQPNQGGYVMSAAAQQVNVEWMQKWANVANIAWVDAGSGTYDLSLEMTNLSTGGGVKGYVRIGLSGNRLLQRPLVLDDDSPDLTRSPTNFMYSAAGHELGHAIGIDHTFANGSTSQPTVTPAFNNVDWSIMSYSSGPVTGNRVVDTAMYGDILVAQYLYGANTSYNAGNTTYNFDSNNLIPFTIWDGGGASDTILANNATGAVTIDIRDDYGNTPTDRDNRIPISGGTVKFWVAKNANIENAIGGDYNDDITGNHLANYLFGGAAGDIIKGGAGIDALMGGASHTDTTETGNDTLSGGADGDIIFGNGGNDVLYGGEIATSSLGSGNDTLFGGLGNDLIYGHDGNDLIIGGPGQDSIYGGGGSDTYVIGWGNQVDLIYQFEGAGVAGGDVLRIINNVNNSGIDTVAEVIAAMTTDGNHSWLNLGGGNGVLIAWVIPTRFVESDFSFGNTVS